MHVFLPASLSDRLLDYDENVRKHVVAALCDVACSSLKFISIETLKLVADRLRDKTVLSLSLTHTHRCPFVFVFCNHEKDALHQFKLNIDSARPPSTKDKYAK